jgi:hypothetical protein
LNAPDDLAIIKDLIEQFSPENIFWLKTFFFSPDSPVIHWNLHRTISSRDQVSGAN